MNYIILGLAVWRASSIMVSEEGPYMVFYKIRFALGIRYNEHSERYIDIANPHLRTLAGIFNCMHCMSVWVGLFYTLLYLLDPWVALAFALPFAFSAVSVVLAELFEWLEQLQ